MYFVHVTLCCTHKNIHTQWLYENEWLKGRNDFDFLFNVLKTMSVQYALVFNRFLIRTINFNGDQL